MKNTISQTTEQELEEAFLEDPEFGLRVLYADFRDVIARYISSRLWGIPAAMRAEDVKDAFQETMLALAAKVKAGGTDWHKPMALVFRIASFKAADVIRARRLRHKQDVDGAIDQIAKDLAGTQIGLEWRLQSKVEWKEFQTVLLQAVSTVLTEKQAIVARCYIDNYEDFGEREIYAPLARLVGEITGNDENAMTIKKQWLEAKERLVTELARKGFKFLEIEE